MPAMDVLAPLPPGYIKAALARPEINCPMSASSVALMFIAPVVSAWYVLSLLMLPLLLLGPTIFWIARKNVLASLE